MLIDTLFRNVHLATMTDGLGEIRDGALGVRDGIICWVGRESDLPTELDVTEEIDGQGGWLLPGFIDCHTHLVWAGNRANEFEARLEGTTYQEICAAGGGILSTVRATRKASEEELLDLAVNRARAFQAEGVTTLDIKSGYGLDLETELKMLCVARRVGEVTGMRVRTGFLGAHTCSPEFAGSPDDYITYLIEEVMPRLGGLADYVDAFCEGVGFSPEQTRRVFSTAKEMGLPVRLHADQLSDLGGAGLAADAGALSADHVEYTSPESVQKMAASGTVAVLLPVAYFYLRETQMPPIEEFRRQGVPMAVSTDCNPGTAPCTSLLLALNMACTLFRLTPTEALRGATAIAAQVLGVADIVGQLTEGLAADVSLWAVDHPRDLCAQIGPNRLANVYGQNAVRG